MCDALAAAHAAGVVHRDVKASNILVEDGPPRRVKLLDFGVAKLTTPEPPSIELTSEGAQLGTATCMAPEQVLGGAIDARTDIYAVGVLLYTLLTGRLPFAAVTPPEIMRLQLYQAAPRPSARAPTAAALDAVVLRCMEKTRSPLSVHRGSARRDAHRGCPPRQESGRSPGRRRALRGGA